MERLQKKCFLVSACLHGLLLGVLVFGSGFLMGGKKQMSLPVLEMIPEKFIVTDRMTTGGGNPNVTAPPAAAQAIQSPPPVPATPTPPAPAPRVAAPAPAPTPPTKTEKSFELTRTAPPKKTADSGKPKTLTLTPTKKSSATTKKGASKSDVKNATPADDATAREWRDKVGTLAGVVKDSFSPGTSVETAGPGGAAFINYSQLVQTKYQMGYSQLVRAQPDLARGDSEVDVDVVLGRDGRVISARVVKPSANSALNKLVNRLIKEVIKEIAPFPSDATDERRTFNLTFELKAKLAG